MNPGDDARIVSPKTFVCVHGRECNAAVITLLIVAIYGDVVFIVVERLSMIIYIHALQSGQTRCWFQKVNEFYLPSHLVTW